MANANTRKTARSTPPAPPPTPTPLTFANLLVQRQDSPVWVADMHRYYAEHGYYRAADLDRLLGPPRGYTEGRAITDFAGNRYKK